MKNRKKLIVLIALSILIILVIAISISIAFMKSIDDGENITEVSLSSCAKIKLNGSNSVNLTNSYPMSRNKGLQTTPYTFTVASYCDSYVGFNLYLAILENNTLDASNIHYIITNKGSKEALVEGILSGLEEANFTSAEETELKTGLNANFIKIYKMFSNKVPLKGERSYDLYLFVDEKTEIDTSSKIFKAGIAIKSYDRVSGANVGDYCAKGENLNSCISILADLYKSDETLIYHHDGSLANGIDDGSYRYAGAIDEVNNFVCFGSDNENCPYNNLYRIIGVINGKIKLIRYDYATRDELGEDGAYAGTSEPKSYYKGNLETIDVYYWNNLTKTNTWSESDLNKTNLNTNFINNIGSTWANKISMTSWMVGGSAYTDIISAIPSLAYKNEIISPSENITYDAKIGVIYIHDYGLATIPKYWNITMINFGADQTKYFDWLYIGHSDWAITKVYNTTTAFFIYGGGSVGTSDVYSRVDGIRPVFFLNENVKYKKGSGIKSDPIRIIK